MNKTLFGLALISFNWENGKKDIIDCYVPLACSSILLKSHQKITREHMQNDFKEVYGIQIPLGACESILKRMAKGGILEKDLGEYKVNYEEIKKNVKNDERENLDNAFHELIIDLKRYAQEVFNVPLSEEEIESGIISFFKEYDLDLLFANNNGDSILPKVRESKKTKYIIAKFITELQKNERSRFQTILKLAKGHAIASLITYEDIKQFTGTLEKVEVYLDAPIIFNLLGLNGDSNRRLSEELIDSLRKNGARLLVFELNFGEVIVTIQDAIKRLNTKKFDISISSRVLRTALRENISPQQLQIKLNQLDAMLTGFDILKVKSPSLKDSEFRYQIDEDKLQYLIEDLYKKEDKPKISQLVTEKIERDVEAISNIFKLRKQTLAISLKSSKAIFLTNNEKIAHAAKVYERTEWEFKSTIPVCVTDIFLSTILWANYPASNDDLNVRQLISECYNIIELDNRLLTKFYEDIMRLHKEKTINDEQFYLLLASNLAYSFLEQKTFNDIEEYTDKMPSEILEDLQFRMSENYDNEKNKNSIIEKNVRRIANLISKMTFCFLGVFLILVSFWVRTTHADLNKNWISIATWSIAALLGIFGILRWMEKIPTKTKIESVVEEWVFKTSFRILTKN